MKQKLLTRRFKKQQVQQPKKQILPIINIQVNSHQSKPELETIPQIKLSPLNSERNLGPKINQQQLQNQSEGANDQFKVKAQSSTPQNFYQLQDSKYYAKSERATHLQIMEDLYINKMKNNTLIVEKKNQKQRFCNDSNHLTLYNIPEVSEVNSPYQSNPRSIQMINEQMNQLQILCPKTKSSEKFQSKECFEQGEQSLGTISNQEVKSILKNQINSKDTPKNQKQNKVKFKSKKHQNIIKNNNFQGRKQTKNNSVPYNKFEKQNTIAKSKSISNFNQSDSRTNISGISEISPKKVNNISERLQQIQLENPRMISETFTYENNQNSQEQKDVENQSLESSINTDSSFSESITSIDLAQKYQNNKKILKQLNFSDASQSLLDQRKASISALSALTEEVTSPKPQFQHQITLNDWRTFSCQKAKILTSFTQRYSRHFQKRKSVNSYRNQYKSFMPTYVEMTPNLKQTLPDLNECINKSKLFSIHSFLFKTKMYFQKFQQTVQLILSPLEKCNGNFIKKLSLYDSVFLHNRKELIHQQHFQRILEIQDNTKFIRQSDTMKQSKKFKILRVMQTIIQLLKEKYKINPKKIEVVQFKKIKYKIINYYSDNYVKNLFYQESSCLQQSLGILDLNISNIQALELFQLYVKKSERTYYSVQNLVEFIKYISQQQGVFSIHKKCLNTKHQDYVQLLSQNKENKKFVKELFSKDSELLKSGFQKYSDFFNVNFKENLQEQTKNKQNITQCCMGLDEQAALFKDKLIIANSYIQRNIANSQNLKNSIQKPFTTGLSYGELNDYFDAKIRFKNTSEWKSNFSFKPFKEKLIKWQFQTQSKHMNTQDIDQYCFQRKSQISKKSITLSKCQSIECILNPTNKSRNFIDEKQQKENNNNELQKNLQNALRVGAKQSIMMKNRAFVSYEIKKNLIKGLPEQSLLLAVSCNSFLDFIYIVESVEVDLEFKDKEGNTALNIATQSMYYDIFTQLVKIGANINTQNNIGNTPLHYALHLRMKTFANELIQLGADQKILNQKGNNCWDGI